MEEERMSSTALGAEKEKAIIFISDAHEKFYYEKLKEVRYAAWENISERAGRSGYSTGQN